jgi:hypothetical protein
MVRFADDVVAGFQHQHEAEEFLDVVLWALKMQLKYLQILEYC